MDSTSTLPTCQDLANELHASVAQLPKTWQLAKTPTDIQSDAATPLVQQAELHPLGPVNLDAVHGEFTKNIQQLRRSLQGFKDQTLGSTAFGLATSNALLRKIGNCMKDESRNLALQQQCDQTFQQCLTLLKARSGDPGLRAQQRVHDLQQLAQTEGMTHYIDPSPHGVGSLNQSVPTTTVTLCGSIVVVDIDLASATGETLGAKVTYANGAAPDTKVDALLKAQLQTPNLDLFAQSMAVLARLDRLTKLHERVDFFRNLHAIRRDLQTLYDLEGQAIGVKEDAKAQKLEILRRGHGLPVPDSLFPGPTLLYWAPEPVYRNPIVRLHSVDDLDKSIFHKLWISVEESTVPTCFLPLDKCSFITANSVVDTQIVDLDQPPNPDTGLEPTGEVDAPNPGIPQLRVTYLHPTPEHGAAAQARFVAHLLPTVPVTETYARSLSALGSVTDHHDFGVQQSWQNTAAYEEILLHTQSPLGTNPSATNILVSDTKSISLQDKFNWSLPVDTIPNADSSTFSHRRFNLAYTGGTTSGGVLVSRIPFTHPSQLHVMIQVLRQHCIFNTLFQSCFNHTTHRPTSTRDPRDLKALVQLAQHAVSVEVTTEPPVKLTVSLTLPLVLASSTQSHQYCPMVFEITVSVNPIPRVQVQPWSKTDAPGVAKVLGQVDLLSQLLQATCESNDALVANLKKSGIISSDRVEQAMKATDRKFYSPQNPYEDSPQSIGHGATISAPHMHGYALEYLQEALQPGVKVLDVGSGSGYLTACMAELVGPQGKVVGVEHIPELVTWSRQNVQRARPDYLEQGRILFVQGDGRLGYSPEAPYDVIHVGAASEGRPTQMLEQLKSPGKMFVPVEDSSHLGQSIILYSKTSDGKVTQHTLMGVAYVPLTDPEIQTGRGLYL